MKMRMFTVLLTLCLLCGAMCSCDYVADINDNGITTSTTIDGIDETATTILTTVATTQKVTTKSTTTTTKRIITTTTTTKRIITTTTKKATEKPAETMVWIPASGSKYHRNSSCSNMKNPSKVTKSYAIEMGYTPCKKCY